MKGVVEAIDELALSDAPVLLQGERGTGRELIARAIHYRSERRGENFVAVCASTIPRPLIDEELHDQRSGTLRSVSGGTLLLKDVGSLPRGPQRQLAKVLGKRANRSSVDVRVLTAVTGDLEPAVDADTFDRDLYARLGALKIEIPPLRRRLNDLPRLAELFVTLVCRQHGRRKMKIAPEAMDRLSEYTWPGNVAELKEVARTLVQNARKKSKIDCGDVERALPSVSRVPLEDMPFEELVSSKLRGFLRRVDGYPLENLYEDVIVRVERPLLQLVLEHTSGNQLAAARILGLNRNTLRKKLVDMGLAPKPAKKARRKRGGR